MIVYQHEDGRIAVVGTPEQADFAVGEPAWHRYGPPDILSIAQAEPTAQYPGHPITPLRQEHATGGRSATLGQIAYEAYHHDCPRATAWDQSLEPAERWEAAARAVLKADKKGLEG